MGNHGTIHWLTKPSKEPLLRGLQPSELVLHWHGDRIHLPSTATLLGSSFHCPAQVFRLAQSAISVQCHFELSGSNLERWIQEDHDFIVSAMGPEGPERLRQDHERFGDSLHDCGRVFINNALHELSASTNKL